MCIRDSGELDAPLLLLKPAGSPLQQARAAGPDRPAVEKRPQVCCEVARRFVSLARLLGEAFHHDRFQVAWDGANQLAERTWFGCQNPLDDVVRSVLWKRRLASQQFVERGPQAEELSLI